MKTNLSLLIISASLLSLQGCSRLDRLSEVGNPPRLTQIVNPQANPNYAEVTMPMPNPRLTEQGQNSLWNTGARSFFKDQRAQEVGDILTIKISFSDKADMSNATNTSRSSKENIKINNFLGYETHLNKVLPNAVNPANLINTDSNPTHAGTGTIKRAEALSAQVAATIIQVLPNGNFVVSGRQEIRVNNEVRELLVTGIVRPQDIMSDNSVTYDKIAEARISYGGRGQLSDPQQVPWGNQIIDIISPF